jgi:hypothetical protein
MGYMSHLPTITFFKAEYNRVVFRKRQPDFSSVLMLLIRQAEMNGVMGLDVRCQEGRIIGSRTLRSIPLCRRQNQ